MSKNDEKTKINLQSSTIKPGLKDSKKIKLELLKSQKMTNYRIIQKNLVYVIGLSEKLTNKELLSKYEYFGQYGQTTKIIVNKNKAYYGENQKKPSYSAYISYSTPAEASVAILAIDSVIADDNLIRASFGTTKYCSFYLKNADCLNKDCLYMHSPADNEVIVNKEELTSNNNSNNKNIFYEQHLLAIKLAGLYNKDVKKNLLSCTKKKTVFPSVESIYNKEIVIENDPEYMKKSKTPIVKSKNNFQHKNDEKKLSTDSLTPVAKDETKIEKSEATTSAGSSVSNNKDITIERENSIDTTPTIEIKKSIYRNREKSRFPFVSNFESDNTGSNIEITDIPDYVFDVINKKVSRYSFFKKFENQFVLENIKNDKIYFEESFMKCGHYRNDSWTDFIFTNMNIEN